MARDTYSSSTSGVYDVLEQQLRESRTDLYDVMLNQLSSFPPEVYRWVPEMLEISQTLGKVGMTTEVFLGAPDIYRFVANTPLAKETPENWDQTRAGKEIVQLLAAETQPI